MNIEQEISNNEVEI